VPIEKAEAIWAPPPAEIPIVPYRTGTHFSSVLKFRSSRIKHAKKEGEIPIHFYSVALILLTVKVPVPFTLPWLVERAQKAMRVLLIFV
jgi:NADH:ubiquinone oxidoreductase subunit 3 (subunit A)